MFPDCVHTLVVDTGNLITFNELKRKTTQSPTDELIESVTGTLELWENKPLEISQVAECTNVKHVTSVDKNDRKNLKLTIKIFMYNFDPDALLKAVETAMNHLDVYWIDSIIVAFPPSMCISDISKLWSVLEELVQCNKVITIGVSDLDINQLRELYSLAQVKPSINHVNLESCCVMPVEMTAYAKENDIQLLTHSDPKSLLPSEMLGSIIMGKVSTVEVWQPEWIVRYSVLVKCRGIIQNKGYILSTSKKKEFYNGVG